MNRMSSMSWISRISRISRGSLMSKMSLMSTMRKRSLRMRGVKTEQLPERDSLDIGMEQLVFDTNEVVHEGEKETRLAHTSVGAHTKDKDPQLSETEGSMVQNTASSFDEAMRNGVMDFRASFDLAPECVFYRPGYTSPQEKAQGRQPRHCRLFWTSG